MTESYSNLSVLYKYYTSRAEVPSNFNLLEDKSNTPKEFERAIENWITKMPYGATFNSVVFCLINFNINSINIIIAYKILYSTFILNI